MAIRGVPDIDGVPVGEGAADPGEWLYREAGYSTGYLDYLEAKLGQVA